MLLRLLALTSVAATTALAAFATAPRALAVEYALAVDWSREVPRRSTPEEALRTEESRSLVTSVAILPLLE